MALRVTILGCGGSGGVPLLGGEREAGEWGDCDPAEPRNRRTRSSALVEGPGGGRLLIDAGPDLRAQLLAAGAARLMRLCAGAQVPRPPSLPRSAVPTHTWRRHRQSRRR